MTYKGGQDKVLNIRVNQALIDRLDAYAQGLADQHAGMSFSRTDGIRKLLIEGLDRAGMPKVKSKPKRKG